MVWITLGDDDNILLAEIEAQTDRAAAIIAQAYLEERLLTAIQARLNADATIFGALFKGTGAIAAFSTRINLGFLLGLYGDTVRKLLHQIKDIRNDFAHSAHPINFNTPSIADRCKNLDVEWIATYIGDAGECDTFHVVPTGKPRDAFMNAIKLLLFLCDRELRLLPPRKPASPVVTLRQASPETQ